MPRNPAPLPPRARPRAIAIRCTAIALLLAAPAHAAPPARDEPRQTVPVVVAHPQARDVPVYASGLGTVTALNSALVRSRVDGMLDSVAFTEGQEVKAGDLLAVIDPRPYQAVLDQAAARQAQDVASLQNQRRDLHRTTALAQDGFATRQLQDSQSAGVQGGGAQVQGDRAAVEAAALNLSFTRITAPIAGRVGLRQINPGNLVHATDTQGIVTITQLAPIGLLFTLPERAVPEITDAGGGGQGAQVLAMQTDPDRLLATGTLLTIDSAIDTTTGTIQLKAQFANTDHRLWPGQFVQARIRLRVLPHVLTLPARAVQRGPDGLFVYVMNTDRTAARRTISEYQEQDGIAAIRDGLRATDQVVIDGQSRVGDGTLLDPRTADG